MSKLDEQETIASLQKNLPKLMEKNKVVGVSIALIRSGRVIWSQGFGLRDKEKKLPMKNTTPIEVASLTKPVFAYIVLKYCEEGLLDLDTPLEKYLPEVYIQNQPKLQYLTARHVLSHTTGFPNWRPKGESLEIHFTPGERFSYSGEGYVYLQKVLEQLSGENTESIFQKRFFKPLELKSASLLWNEEYDKIAALGYLKNDKQQNMKPKSANVAGSLHISTTDYASFMCSLLNKDNDTNFHLNEKSIENMFSFVVPVSDSGLSNRHSVPKSEITESTNVFWGLGWGLEKIENNTCFWHWGNNSSFHHFVLASREERSGVVIMSNSERASSIWKELLKISAPNDHPGFNWLMSFYS